MSFLLTRLTGKARQVFNGIEEGDATVYKKCKGNILKRFKIIHEPSECLTISLMLNT